MKQSPLRTGAILARDAVRSGRRRRGDVSGDVPAHALPNALAWLCRTHDVTGRLGSSKGFSLLHGWLPAYPETTGYVLGTLLEYGERIRRPDAYRVRAVEMGAWESSIQGADGGIMEGHLQTRPRRAIVFNTGMVLHGWVDLLERGEQAFAEPAQRAVSFLVNNLQMDGSWDPLVEYQGIPHTYNARVAWAMLRHAALTGGDQAREAAHRHLDWVVAQQRPNGWFDMCVFKAGTDPSTHAIAYTLRGLLESYVIDPRERYLDSVLLASETLIRKLEVLGTLPGTFDEAFRPSATHVCLTGAIQLGGVWLRLYQVTGDPRFLNAGLKAVELGAAHQETMRWSAVRGAIAGSSPHWGRYAPFQYPNWATKFLADALMLREDCLP